MGGGNSRELLIPGPIGARCVTVDHLQLDLGSADPWSLELTLTLRASEVRTLSRDLGSVSTGYSDRPVARAIKIKHAGLNLTGRVVQLVLDAMRDTR